MAVSIHHSGARVDFRNAGLSWIIRAAGAPHVVVFRVCLKGHRVFKGVVHRSWSVSHWSQVENLSVICDLVLRHDEALLGILTV